MSLKRTGVVTRPGTNSQGAHGGLREAVDFGDINPFIKALASPAGYQQQFPDCDIMNGDVNIDGEFDFQDINPFIKLLME